MFPPTHLRLAGDLALTALIWFYGRRVVVVAASVVAASVLVGGEAGEQQIVDPLGHTPLVRPTEVRLVVESMYASRDVNPAPFTSGREAADTRGAA